MLKILSFNIFSNNGDLKLFNQFLDKYKPDIICTQEDDFQKNTFGKEYLLAIKHGSYCNGVGVYYNINTISIDEFKNIEKLSINNKYLKNISKRNSIIFSIRNIKIATLHLEGGRYVDKSILYDKDNDYLNYKLLLLKNIINYKPNIICGDFNSIWSNNINQLNNFMTSQIKYFKKIYKKKNLSEFELNQINLWNYEPYLILKTLNYNYIEFKNEINNFTNSRGKTIVDTFWYNNKKKKIIKSINSEIINIGEIDKNKLFGNISDHKPILLTINL